MVQLTLILAAALAGLVGALWLIGAQEPLYRLRRLGKTWFVALRGAEWNVLAPGVRTLWAADGDFALIGADAPYWTRFFIVSGRGHTPLRSEAFEDAYVARLRLFAPPAIVLGLIKCLVWLGVLSRPSIAEISQDDKDWGFRPELMPTRSAIAALLGRPADYAPAMVNFLHYFDQARCPKGGSGRAAYRRYGMVALRTVYRTGGRFLFYGAVSEVVRPAKAGPTMGAWNEVAAMHYPNARAILSMEHVPEYRAALAHRDAGLERTVVIASTPL